MKSQCQVKFALTNAKQRFAPCWAVTAFCPHLVHITETGILDGEFFPGIWRCQVPSWYVPRKT